MNSEQSSNSNDNPVTQFTDRDPITLQKSTSFRYVLGKTSGKWVSAENVNPSYYKFIELIARQYTGLDLMFAYNDPQARGDGSLFLGNWNGGCL